MPAAPRRTGHRSAPMPVPAFFLYDEPLQAPDERLIHVETIAARSRQHDWVIHPHRHRDLHQVILLHRGRVEVRLDGRQAGLRSPAAVVVPPGTVHSFRFQPDTAGLVISFAAGLARELSAASTGLLAHLEQATVAGFERAALDATDLWPLGDMLLREFGRSAPGRHAALRGMLGALLANLLRLMRDASPHAASTATPERELVAQFRQQIERRFREHASVASHAAELHVSEARLRRACLAVSGQSPIELVHLRLLVEAERQLRYTSMSVAQVAYYLGFDDPAYFSRFFTRRMGVSPRLFRVDGGLATAEGT